MKCKRFAKNSKYQISKNTYLRFKKSPSLLLDRKLFEIEHGTNHKSYSKSDIFIPNIFSRNKHFTQTLKKKSANVSKKLNFQIEKKELLEVFFEIEAKNITVTFKKIWDS